MIKRLAVALSLLCITASAQQKPWPIRGVIVTTFEIGKDTGDIPGEFQLWAEREHLDEVVDFPGGFQPLRTNKAHTILGMVSGTTLVNATASMMALGLDPRFDLSHAYILINGIAGVDPADASVGSVAWARYVIGDVSRSIDPHDAPADWPYGYFPISAHAPKPPKYVEAWWTRRSNLSTLNISLAEWAYAQTKDLKLGDDEKVAAFRADFTGYPNAQRPPFVLMGDTYASNSYWHGATMTTFANDWTTLFTEGKGNFVMTEMEDSGFLGAIQRLSPMHRVDENRVLVLRGGSNYCMPRPGHTAVESITSPYIGTRITLESLYASGSLVLHKLVDNWAVTENKVPKN